MSTFSSPCLSPCCQTTLKVSLWEFDHSDRQGPSQFLFRQFTHLPAFIRVTLPTHPPSLPGPAHEPAPPLSHLLCVLIFFHHSASGFLVWGQFLKTYVLVKCTKFTIVVLFVTTMFFLCRWQVIRPNLASPQYKNFAYILLYSRI